MLRPLIGVDAAQLIENRLDRQQRPHCGRKYYTVRYQDYPPGVMHRLVVEIGPQGQVSDYARSVVRTDRIDPDGTITQGLPGSGRAGGPPRP